MGGRNWDGTSGGPPARSPGVASGRAGGPGAPGGAQGGGCRRLANPSRWEGAPRKEALMLEVHRVADQMVDVVVPVIDGVERRDRPLADQLRRALQSVVLNIA